MNNRVTGIVKWWNDSKGYGFLRQTGRDEDIFVHYSAIKSDGFQTLSKGETVTFELRNDANGKPMALEVERNKQNEKPV